MGRFYEKKFTKWEDLTGGGRKYYLEVKGRHGWMAKYVRDLNA